MRRPTRSPGEGLAERAWLPAQADVPASIPHCRAVPRTGVLASTHLSRSTQLPVSALPICSPSFLSCTENTAGRACVCPAVPVPPEAAGEPLCPSQARQGPAHWPPPCERRRTEPLQQPLSPAVLHGRGSSPGCVPPPPPSLPTQRSLQLSLIICADVPEQAPTATRALCAEPEHGREGHSLEDTGRAGCECRSETRCQVGTKPSQVNFSGLLRIAASPPAMDSTLEVWHHRDPFFSGLPSLRPAPPGSPL